MRTRTGKRWGDRRDQLTGHVLGMCAKSQKCLALASGQSEPWISRQVRGGEGPLPKFIAMIERLGGFGSTDAMRLALLPLAVALRGSHEAMDDDDLRSALYVALVEEERRESVEDLASLQCTYGLNGPEWDHAQWMRESKELRDALISESAAHMTLLSLLLELDRRAVEGRT